MLEAWLELAQAQMIEILSIQAKHKLDLLYDVDKQGQVVKECVFYLFLAQAQMVEILSIQAKYKLGLLYYVDKQGPVVKECVFYLYLILKNKISISQCTLLILYSMISPIISFKTKPITLGELT